MHFAIQKLISRGYWAPAGDDGGAAGGGSGDNVDRGDDFQSPLDTAGKGDKMEDDADKGDKGDDKADKGDGKDGKADEADETPEEKAEREKLEAEEERRKRVRIPKARFDEALGKAKAREQALLDEIEKLKGGQQAAATTKAVGEMRTKISELQDKYEDLILDGKKDEARKVRRQVDELREELTEYQTSTKSEAARRAAIEEMGYNAQLAGYEAKYPALNPEHEDFDEDKTDEVATLLNAFVKSGSKRADALAKAIKYVLGAPPSAKADDKDDATKKAADARAAEARKKAADADKRQPPNGKNVGLDSDKAGGGKGDVDIMRLSQDKFAKLDEETLSKLRGDEV